jgi:hypothetical protein
MAQFFINNLKTQMKPLLLLLFCLFYFFAAQTNGQRINWIDEYPLSSTGPHYGTAVYADENDNVYFISHHIGGTAEDGTQYGSFIYKYNKTGKLLWRNFYSTTSIAGIRYDKKGGLYLSGVFQNQADFGCGQLEDPIEPAIDKYVTLFVARLDTNGNCQWSQMVPFAQFGRMAMDEAGDNIYVIGNNYHPTNFDQFHFTTKQRRQYIAKYDRNGNCQWVNVVLASGNPFNVAVNDKYIAVTGKIDSWTGYFGLDSAYSIIGPNTHNVYTVLYDFDGNIVWVKHTVKKGYKGNSVTIDKENNIYVTGYFGDAIIEGREFENNSTHNAFVVKYNEQGDTVFVQATMGPSFEEGRALHAAEDGVYWSGTFNGQVTIADTTVYSQGSSFFIAKMDFDFKKAQWIKVFRVGWQADIYQLAIDNQNNLLVAGNYTSFLESNGTRLLENSSHWHKPFVISINPYLEPLPPEEEEEDVDEPAGIGKKTGLNSFRVFPNPTHSSIFIETDIQGNKKIIIRNTTGTEVFGTATDNFKFEILNLELPAGIYFVELQTESERLVKKVVISR